MGANSSKLEKSLVKLPTPYIEALSDAVCIPQSCAEARSQERAKLLQTQARLTDCCYMSRL